MSVLESAIGWLAPATCVGCGVEGSALCISCSATEILPHGQRCWRCGAISEGGRTCKRCRQVGSPRYVWISTDYEGVAKKLVQKYKFGQLRAVATSIATVMAETFLSFNSDAEIGKLDYLVVAVPTATSRVRQRSFDHAGLLAKSVARRLRLQSCPALGRIGQARQLGTSRSVRLAQPAGSYFIRDAKAINGRNVLLIDDVLTTGATLQAATSALRRAGAKRVDALVFAKRL